MAEERFKGQVALVAGGADGFGKAVARRIAREGGRVVLMDLHPDRLEQVQSEFAAANLRVMTVKGDVTHEESVKAVVQRVVNAGKRLDIMVNAAGVPGPASVNITDYATDEFDRVCGVNLRGAFLMTKHVIEPMMRNGYGRILLVAAMSGKDGAAGLCGQSAAKAGVIGLAKAVGKEFAGTGITVNALAPDVIRTPLIEKMEPSEVKRIVADIPMRRPATLEEAASLAAWTVSPECSFTSGFTFDLSGGRAVY